MFLRTEDSVKRNSRATTLANAAFSFSSRVVMFVRIVKALRSTAVKKSSSLPGGPGLIPGQGTKIPQAVPSGPKK